MNCDVNFDDCIGHSCVNGGTCVDGIDSYSCLCVPGYSGINCSVNVDDCIEEPCFSGHCVDLLNNFEVRMLTLALCSPNCIQQSLQRKCKYDNVYRVMYWLTGKR